MLPFYGIEGSLQQNFLSIMPAMTIFLTFYESINLNVLKIIPLSCWSRQILSSKAVYLFEFAYFIFLKIL